MLCPFCNGDPYEYVDVGIGRVPVAVNCCDGGVLYFDDENDYTVEQVKEILEQKRKAQEAYYAEQPFGDERPLPF